MFITVSGLQTTDVNLDARISALEENGGGGSENGKLSQEEIKGGAKGRTCLPHSLVHRTNLCKPPLCSTVNHVSVFDGFPKQNSVKFISNAYLISNSRNDCFPRCTDILRHDT